MENNVETEKKPIYKNWWFWGIVILIVLGIFGGSLINNNQLKKVGETTTSTIDTGKQQKVNVNELKEKINIEALGISKAGDFVFKVTNNNNQTIGIDNINIVFKDIDGNFMEKADSDSQYFGIRANSDLILYASGFKKDFSKYPNYEFEFELSSEYMSKELVVDNFEIVANNTGEQISVQVKNNNDIEINNMQVLVAYYKNGEIVGCQDGYEYETNTKAQGSAYINVNYPEDNKYKSVEFDDYQVYLVKANKTY